MHFTQCAHFLPKIKCILHVRNNYENHTVNAKKLHLKPKFYEMSASKVMKLTQHILVYIKHPSIIYTLLRKMPHIVYYTHSVVVKDLRLKDEDKDKVCCTQQRLIRQAAKSPTSGLRLSP